jgi:hypothetical protein
LVIGDPVSHRSESADVKALRGVRAVGGQQRAGQHQGDQAARNFKLQSPNTNEDPKFNTQALKNAESGHFTFVAVSQMKMKIDSNANSIEDAAYLPEL